MKYTVKPTAQFRRDYRRAVQQGQDMAPLDAVIAALAEGETLPPAYRDRPLAGGWSGHRECRIGDNRFLIYRIHGDILVLALTRIGTLTELYGKGGTAMKKSTSLRMLLRSPVKTAVTLLLIAAASFLFLYNLLDYAMTRREYTRTYASYHGTFSVMRPEDRNVGDGFMYMALLGDFFASDQYGNPAYNPAVRDYETYHLRSLTPSDLEVMESLPYITKTEKRYVTGGLADFRRHGTYSDLTIVHFMQNASRVVFTATLHGFRSSDPGYSPIPDYGNWMNLELRDVEVLAGTEDDLMQDRAYIDKRRLGVAVAVVEPDIAAERLLIYKAANNTGVFSKSAVTPEEFAALEIGKRYVFVASVDLMQLNQSGIRDDEEYMYDTPYVYIGDDSTYGTCSLITPLEGEPENWLETEKFAGLRKMMEIIDTDQRTLDVHYLEDMSTIRRYQEGKLVPVRGRTLTPEDTENRNPVCLIPENMAQSQHLELGDTLHLELGDKLLEQYVPFGAVAYSPLRYADHWTGQDFTIVGTYAESGLERLSAEDQFWAYGDNSVMVPLSFLPETADTANHEFKPPEVSFVVGDADSILPFRDEVIPKLDELGYYVYYFDGGWPAVRDSLRQAGSLGLVKLAAFAVSALLVLWLTVYLYILRKKKEYAVMRALGCPAPQARRSLLFPLLALAVPAILLGTLGAAIYAHAAAERNAAEFAALSLTLDTSVPLPMVLAGFVGSLAMLLVLAWAALVRVAKTPPLELLQGTGVRNLPRRQVSLPPEPTGDTVYADLPELPEPTYHPHTALRHTLGYVGKHLRRTPVKSLLAVLLALVLAFSMGFFTLLRSTYRELYQNIEIHPRFLNGFSYNKALEAEKTGDVRDPFYLFTREDVESNFVQDKLVLTNDLSRVCSAEITWRENMGPEIFQKKSGFCVITRDLADALDLDFGSRIEFCGWEKFSYLASSHPGATYEELVEIYHESNGKLTVVGIAEEEGMRAYGPIGAWQNLSNLFADYVPLDLAEYTLNDYHRATAFRSYAWRLIYGTRADFSLETAEADRVYQTYRLLELLYPIAFALALLLGGVLPAGIILQSAREASLLRVLGTTKRRTRAMLSLEQVILCLLGLLCAAVGLIGLKGAALLPVSGLLWLYAAAHFCLCILGTALAAVSVTRRNVLELLQVKE